MPFSNPRSQIADARPRRGRTVYRNARDLAAIAGLLTLTAHGRQREMAQMCENMGRPRRETTGWTDLAMAPPPRW